jgi:hexosaminidase
VTALDKLDNLFFEFVYAQAKGEVFAISADSSILGAENYALRYARSVVALCGNAGRKMTVSLELRIPASVKEAAGDAFAENEESYALVIKEDKIGLYAVTHRGLLYAVSTLKQLIEADAVRELVLFDYPDKAVRGYRVYTPGVGSFDAFKAMVDNLVYYKYNSIIIEVGGAMEYKRRPEINAHWVEFCKEVHQSPYEARRIQQETHPTWKKNSIHADNGDGSFITQEQMRQLIAYCRERELDVIPEVPTLSHCDYIVMTYPEIREREEDTYPDTYCPSNPKSYEIVFDILDEIIDVFQPSYMNIGHDECYTLAKCPLCKDKDPVDLYVGDIIKINDYLRARNVKALMWSEKFIDNVMLLDEDGKYHGYGGIGDPLLDVPKCIGCVGKVPKDVTLLHWYWSLCEGDREKELQDMGYPMFFGNFQGTSLKDYRARIGGVAGGFISNWGSFEEEHMQRNGQNFNLLSTAWVFWNHTYDTPQSAYVQDLTKEALYARYKKTLGEDVVELLHTTDHFRPYKAFYDGYFIVPEDWTIGHHVVTYTDGTEAVLPIVYGYNIRTASGSGCKDSETIESAESKTTDYVEVIGASNPLHLEGKLWYRTAYRNPYPQKKIQSIRCEAKDGIHIEAKYDFSI